jgi:hypothetical protein
MSEESGWHLQRGSKQLPPSFLAAPVEGRLRVRVAEQPGAHRVGYCGRTAGNARSPRVERIKYVSATRRTAPERGDYPFDPPEAPGTTAAEWRFDHAAVDNERIRPAALRTSRPKVLPMGRTVIFLRKLMQHTMVAVRRTLDPIQPPVSRLSAFYR